MGVTGLWQVIQPCARPTNLATLNRRRLAVDASIWIYQFLKAMRDKDGNAMYNGHIVGFFRRICKLLFYGVQPVFVFDGGAPALKRMTIQGRKKRREGRRDDAVRTAGKLLAVQMQKLADEEEERRKKKKVANAGGTEDTFVPINQVDDQEEGLPDMSQVVYVDEIGLPQHERIHNRRFQKQDAYHLPDLPGGIESMGRPEDPRIMSVEELEEYARQFNSGEDINLYDFSKIDFDGDFFKSLPPADRYNILNAARLRSRLRMGVNKEQLDSMFPDRMAFSRFQIERVKERNRLTQRLMFEIGMTGTDLTLTVNGGRIAGDKDREYILVKNDGVEGGWALGVVSKNKDLGKSYQPIDVDEIDIQFQSKEGAEDSDEEEEFEDVPIEGVNRLPKARPGWNATDYMAEQAKAMGASIHELYGLTNEDDDSLFVDDTSNAVDSIFGSQQEESLRADEDEDLSRAIAMSLGAQYGIDTEPEREPEKGAEPVWKQKAAPAPRPITSTTRGSMIAHIVNNRALSEVKAGASKPTKLPEDDDSSDSDIDFGAALAADAKKKKTQPQGPTQTAVPSVPSGPLPFESMDWRKSVFALAKEHITAERNDPCALPRTVQNPNTVETATFEVESEEGDMAGGFVKTNSSTAKEADNEAHSPSVNRCPDQPLPLPPWLLGDPDIRESLKESRAAQVRQVAEHDADLEEQAALYRQQKLNETVFIDSSDDEGSDVEIVEAPLPRPKSQETTHAIEDTRRSMEALSAHEQSLRMLAQSSASENGTAMVETKPNESTTSVENSHATLEPQYVDEDEDLEFEDVEILPIEPPEPPVAASTEREGSPDIFVDIQPGIKPAKPVGNTDEDDIFAGIEAPQDVETYSEPEDDELLVQLAEEAEAHVAFASTLNHKPTGAANRAALDREIAALKAEKQKQQRDSDEVTQVMITEVQSLLRLFGIPYITAPMEAEAQCAELVRLGLVDGIVTDDSDTFLFGGTRVYKNMFNGNKFVECYLAADLEQELRLSRKQLISLAQLLGSDYVEGLPGIGPVTAVELLAEFPGPDGLVQFRDWWAQVHATGKLSEADARSKFKKKFRRAHGKKLFLPPSFPSSAVEEAYMKPQVDASAENFVWGVPDLEGLRRFLMGTVGWGPEQTDEVLVPVIKDMNKRAVEGTQSNITQYFTIAAGSKEMADHGAGGEVFAPRQRTKTSKRMTEAVSRLRARTDGTELVEEHEDAVPSSTPRRKRKARRSAAAVDEKDGGDPEEDYQAAEEEAEDGDAEPSFARDRGKGKKRAKAA